MFSVCAVFTCSTRSCNGCVLLYIINGLRSWQTCLDWCVPELSLPVISFTLTIFCVIKSFRDMQGTSFHRVLSCCRFSWEWVLCCVKLVPGKLFLWLLAPCVMMQNNNWLPLCSSALFPLSYTKGSWCFEMLLQFFATLGVGSGHNKTVVTLCSGSRVNTLSLWCFGMETVQLSLECSWRFSEVGGTPLQISCSGFSKRIKKLSAPDCCS